MFGDMESNQVHGHIDIGADQPTQPVQDVKIVGSSDVSMMHRFMIGVASSVVAGIIVWYAFEKSRK